MPPFSISATRNAVQEPASLVAADAGTFESSPFPAIDGTWVVTVEAWADAGLSAQSSTVVDVSPPSLFLTVDPPPVRLTHDGGAPPDQVDPLAVGAFRRDEQATIHVATNASDLDLQSVRVTVGDATAQASQADGGSFVLTLSPTDGGFDFSVPLWAPTLNAFRGFFPVTVTAADDLGNQGASDGGGVMVTRLRWKRPAGYGPTVVDSGGNVFRTEGRQVVSYSREGVTNWTRPTAGNPRAMALGAVNTQDRQLLYVFEAVTDGGTETLGEAFPAYRPGQPVRTWANSATRPSAVGPAVLSDDVNGHEGVFVAYVDQPTSRTALQWADVTSGALQTSTRVPTVAISPVSQLGSIVARGGSVYVSGDNRIFGFNTASNLGYPEESSLGYPGTLTGFTSTSSELAVEPFGTLTNLVGVGTAMSLPRLFRMTYPTAPFIQTPTALMGMATPLLAGGTVWYVQTEVVSGNSIGRICRATIGGTATCSSDNGESVMPGPILSAGGGLITAVRRGSNFFIQERDRMSLAVRWEGPGPGMLTGLVCSPTQATGIAIGFDANTLFSIVVDAKGLDAAADWPMTLHDPQASRYHSFKLGAFQCP